MTDEQKAVLKDTLHHLLSAHTDQKDLYKMTVTDHLGTRSVSVNRKEYLEFVVAVAYESLSEAFPELEEEIA